MGAKFSGDADEAIADINITPFVDIILVILIIFMVTTPILLNPSIQIQLPKAASGEESSATQLNLTIAADGTTALNGKNATLEEIAKFVAELAKTHPEQQAMIAADQNVAHGKVVAVIDVIKSAGIRKFAISTDRK